MPSKASNRTSGGVPRGVHFIAAILALTGGSFYEEASAYTIDPRFPHLGGLKISSPQNYADPSVQSQLARLDFVVVDFYFNWGGGGAAMNNAVNAIKAKNPNIVIVDYCTIDEVQQHSRGAEAAPRQVGGGKVVAVSVRRRRVKGARSKRRDFGPQPHELHRLEHLGRRLSLRPGLASYLQTRRDLYRQLLLEACRERRLEPRWDERQLEQ